MSGVVEVLCDHPLAALTTLELGGQARRFVRVDRSEDVAEVVRDCVGDLYVLGGGSNLVIADAGVDGTVLALATRGIEVSREHARVVVTAQAGERWQDLVELALAENLAGVECLTGIPGSVGATPIQNVGAYGQEVSETLLEVQVLERATLAQRWLTADQCAFAYRDSLFKREPGRYIVLAVRFAWIPAGAPALRYPELTRALGAKRATASLEEVAATVYELRASKSMVWQASDPNRRSAGSFFTNPIVDARQAGEVEARARALGVLTPDEAMPRFATPDGRVKLAAGWLIERAGFHKGLRRGSVGLSNRHALALVHHGGGTTRALLELAREIRAEVQARLGVTLHMEPTCWGTSF